MSEASTERVPRLAVGPNAVLRSRRIAFVEVDDEVVLYDDDTRRLHRLNWAAATVWRCLDGTDTLAQIAADIAEAYAADPDIVLADVERLACELVAEGLLVRADVPEDESPAARSRLRDTEGRS